MTLLLPIFLVAALLWAFVYARRGSLLIGGTAFVAVGYVCNHNLWSMSAGPVSLTLGRVMLTALVGLFLWRWRTGVIQSRPLCGTDWLVGVFTAYLTIRYAFTTEPLGDASSVSPTWRLIASFWMPAALYWVVSYSRLTQRTWTAMLILLTGLGTYLAFTGIAEVQEQWWAVFPRFIANPEIGAHFGRARGPALMSASLGVFLTICFWAAWFLWARVGRKQQFVLLGAMFLMAVGVYYTYTRSTWLGLAAGLAVVPLLHFPRPWKPVLVTAMVFTGFVGAVALGDKIIHMNRKDSNGSAEHSVYQRASFLHVSLNMFQDAPLVGCGFGRFYDCKLPYLSDRSQQIELESIRGLDHHNTFLSLLTETGIIGFVLFSALLFAWCRSSWQLAIHAPSEDWMRAHGLFSMATMIAYAASAVFHDLTLSPSEQWLLYLTAGVTVGIQGKLRATSAAGVLSRDGIVNRDVATVRLAGI
ncbi:MAG: O-antigen ligase family protein [Planctomycetota bacterium]